MSITFESYSGAQNDLAAISGVIGAPRARLSNQTFVNALYGTLGPFAFALKQADVLYGAIRPFGRFSDTSGVLFGTAGRPTFSGFLGTQIVVTADYVYAAVLPTAVFSPLATNSPGSLSGRFAPLAYFSAGADALRGFMVPTGSFTGEFPITNYVYALLSFYAGMDASDVPNLYLSDGVAFSAATSVQGAILLLQDSWLFTDVLTWLVSPYVQITDTLQLGDAATQALLATLASALSMSSTPSGWLTLLALVQDLLQFAAVPGVTVNSQVSVAVALGLKDAWSAAQLGQLSDAAAFLAALAASATSVATLFDTWTATAQATGGAILYAFGNDALQFSDTATLYAQILQALQEDIAFGLTLFTGQDLYTAWVMTPETRAMRQYLNYPFNSYAQLAGGFYGADQAGIYRLDGTTDAGQQIVASVRSGLMDFGSRQLKRMDRAYLGYSSQGTLCLRVTTTSPEGAKVDYTYKMVPKTANVARENRITIGRGMQSVYWQFELDNSADGSAFELYDMVLLPMMLSRRIR